MVTTLSVIKNKKLKNMYSHQYGSRIMGRREIIQYSSIINIKEDTHKLPRVKTHEWLGVLTRHYFLHLLVF